MATHINTYENSFFKIKLDFPSDWRVRKKENFNTQLKSQANYQLTDNDLPTENDDFRTLFFASRQVAGSPEIFSSKFSMVIHKHINTYDLKVEAKQKDSLIECDFQLLRFLDREAQSIKMIENAGDYYTLTKILAWEEVPKIWLSIYLGGDSLQNFQASEDLLNTVVRI